MNSNYCTVSLEQCFRETFLYLDPPPSHGVIALSGGADSVVLTWLLAHSGDLFPENFTLEAVYVHHGLSTHAGEWAEFCSRYAASLGIPFTCERVTLDYSEGDGTEAAARRARYEVLAKHMIGSAPVLFTAHHANDQAETFFLALKRGSGLPGLASMQPVREFAGGRLFRPLLKVSRSDIENFATSHNLQYVTDESNSDEHYDRNFLRHQIIPLLQERFPGFLDMIGYSTGYISEAEQMVSQIAESDLENCRYSDNSVMISELMKLSEVRGKNVLRYLWHDITGRYPSRSLVKSVLTEMIPARCDAAPCFIENGFSCRRYQDCLYVVREQNETPLQTVRLELNSVFELGGHSWILERAEGGGFALMPDSLSFDYPFSTILHPYTRRHSRSLKKIFSELRIPVWERRRIPLVISEGKVAGLFPDLPELSNYVKENGYVFRRVP